MASKKAEYYLKISATLEQVLARMAQRKSTMLSEIGNMQTNLNAKQAELNDLMARWEAFMVDARRKIDAVRDAPEREDTRLESLKIEAERAVTNLSASV